jgi:hypothetical protein
MRSEVLTAAAIIINVFWDVIQCQSSQKFTDIPEKNAPPPSQILVN